MNATTQLYFTTFCIATLCGLGGAMFGSAIHALIYRWRLSQARPADTVSLRLVFPERGIHKVPPMFVKIDGGIVAGKEVLICDLPNLTQQVKPAITAPLN